MAAFISVALLSKLARWEGNLGFTVGELIITLHESSYYKDNVGRQERDIMFLENIAHLAPASLSEPRQRYLSDVQDRVGRANSTNIASSGRSGPRAVIIVPATTEPRGPA